MIYGALCAALFLIGWVTGRLTVPVHYEGEVIGQGVIQNGGEIAITEKSQRWRLHEGANVDIVVSRDEE